MPHPSPILPFRTVATHRPPAAPWLRHLRLLPVLAAVTLPACSPVPTPTPSATTNNLTPASLNDPLEPVNRAIWAVNRGILEGAIHPTAKVYRTAVPKPVRTSLTNFSHNLIYPVRLINTALQGRWNDAGTESLRFLTNTTVGIGGLFDPASRWDIPKKDADFTETFRAWGWQPQTFLMLPIIGPSDPCDLLGTALDEAAEPWNYAPGSRWITYATTYNRLAESSSDLVRFVRSEADPYSVTRLAWSHASRIEEPDWQVRGPLDPPTLETLAAATIRLQDPRFADAGRTARVRIPSTGKSTPYTFWLQPHPAPLAYVAPGLGSHRLSSTTLSIAENLHRNGFSVVTTSSAFHPEFMCSASTSHIPAHVPTDSADLLALLTEIDHQLTRNHPGRFTKRALVGCSMGAYQALYLASLPPSSQPDSLRFDRFVAINPPVDLHHGIGRLDALYNAPLTWPEKERQARIDNTVLKVARLARNLPSASTVPPFDAVESQYIIGMAFRLTLRDALFCTQQRHNLGVIQTPLSRWHREPAYQEMLAMSYNDYKNRFVFPHFTAKGVTASDFRRFSSLQGFGHHLRNHPDVRVITNKNDFLLRPGDLEWLTQTLGRHHVTALPNGGHLGNLASPAVQQATANALTDLKDPSPRPQ